LARDYYKIQADFPREEAWLSKHSGFLDHFADVGFEEINLGQISVGDGILMRIRHQVPTHAAIFLGKGRILHHMMGRLSCEEDLGPYQDCIAHVLRRKQ
jgi:cell wall-associated NlpC family hydrolase